MSPAVKSMRIERGCYRKDSATSAVVYAVPDLRRIELEAEIERLNTQFSEYKINAEARIKAACQQGFTEGLQQGQAEGQKAATPAIEYLKQLAVDIENGMETVWIGCREGVTNIALEIARKIIGQASEEYRNLTIDLTGQCLRMVREQAKVTIIINPHDADVLREARANLMTMTEGIRTIEIVERNSVPRGGVIVETDAGQLDARLDEQIGVIQSRIQPQWSQPDLDENGEIHNENVDS